MNSLVLNAVLLLISNICLALRKITELLKALNALEKNNVGKVSIGGRNIKCISQQFADCIDLLAEEEQELEALPYLSGYKTGFLCL